MTVEEAVANHLAATSSVEAIVGERVYQLLLPQSPTYPAVRVQLVDEPGTPHLRGQDGLTRARVQVDGFVESSGADPYAAATALGDAIDAALTGAGFSVGGARQITGAHRMLRQVFYEAAELRLVRVLQDFVVWSRPVE